MSFFEDITLVIVNYNSRNVILNSLAPLKTLKNIIVVDNGSTDDSTELIKSAYSHVRLLRLGVNRGFGAGVNQGVRASDTKYTLVISPDTEFTVGCLKRLYQEAESDNKAAILAPSLRVPEYGPELWVKGFNESIHTKANFIADGNFCTWFISGAVMLMRNDYFNKIGGFDENIFLYLEDLDLSIRARAAGFSLIYVPEIEAIHLNSKSTTPTKRLHWQKNWNFAWSHCYILNKYQGVRVARKHALRQIFFKGLKSLFYIVCCDFKRFIRDFSTTHGSYSFLIGSKPKQLL